MEKKRRKKWRRSFEVIVALAMIISQVQMPVYAKTQTAYEARGHFRWKSEMSSFLYEYTHNYIIFIVERIKKYC